MVNAWAVIFALGAGFLLGWFAAWAAQCSVEHGLAEPSIDPPSPLLIEPQRPTAPSYPTDEELSTEALMRWVKR